MAKNGCEFTLSSLKSECGKSLPKGIVKAYLIPYDKVSLTWGTAATTYNVVTAVILDENTKAVVVYDYRTSRFDGTQKANSDGTYEGQYTKTFSWNFKNVDYLGGQDVDALCKYAAGWLLILERDKGLGHSAFEIFGAQTPAKITSVSANYGVDDELENSPTLTLETTEGYWNVTLDTTESTKSDSDAYATNKTYVEQLVATTN